MKLLRRLIAGLAFAAACLPALAADGDAPSPRALDSDATCTRCHDQSESSPLLSIYQTRHGVTADGRTPGCQSCHGPSVAHVKNAGDTDPRPQVDIAFGKKSTTPPAQQAQTCLACHKNGQRNHWDGSQHEASGLACTSCHEMHVRDDKVLDRQTQPQVCFACHKTERAQTHRLSTHPLDAGKMACSNCHNPHGSTGEKLMVKGSVNETCFQCHAEKRGPFLWEHQPVTESCITCHSPHGSNITPLLKVRMPYLCQACHTGDHAAQVNSAANLQGGGVTTANGLLPLASSAGRAQLAGRACLACHSLVHGSNHPAGAKFDR